MTLSFKLPFYQGGLINAQIREAASNHSAARARYESAHREIQRKTRQAFLSINSQLRRISALAEAVTAGESALQAKEEGFAAGLTTNIDVLDAQRDLFRAERNYLKARYDYVLQVLLLEQLSGQLNEEDVSRVNRWLGCPGSKGCSGTSSALIVGLCDSRTVGHTWPSGDLIWACGI